jgi:hypothetical protein
MAKTLHRLIGGKLFGADLLKELAEGGRVHGVEIIVDAGSKSEVKSQIEEVQTNLTSSL